MIVLGFEPYPIQVNLARDASFTATIRSDEPWPAGVAIELRFSVSDTAPPVVWPAALEGGDATWDVPASAVAAVLETRARHARLIYGTDNGDSYLWGRGRVHVE